MGNGDELNLEKMRELACHFGSPEDTTPPKCSAKLGCWRSWVQSRNRICLLR